MVDTRSARAHRRCSSRLETAAKAAKGRAFVILAQLFPLRRASAKDNPSRVTQLAPDRQARLVERPGRGKIALREGYSPQVD